MVLTKTLLHFLEAVLQTCTSKWILAAPSVTGIAQINFRGLHLKFQWFRWFSNNIECKDYSSKVCKSDSYPLLQWKPIKSDEKCFLFQYMFNIFMFSRYLIFYLHFWSCRKNGSIRKIRLMSKFMTSQNG